MLGLKLNHVCKRGPHGLSVLIAISFGYFPYIYSTFPLSYSCMTDTKTHLKVNKYSQTSNIRGIKSQNVIFFSFRLVVVFAQSIEAKC